MTTATMFPDRTNRSDLGDPIKSHHGATVELLLAGGTVWANNAEYLRAELVSYGLKATEVDLGLAYGGTMFRLER